MTMFGFECQECQKGTVRAKKVENYPVTFQHIPFVVPEATIGVCDNPECRFETFDAQEEARWKRLFQEWLESEGKVMSAREIRELRERMRMTMQDFAKLIGITRQSLYHWEDDNREVPQSRMADLMLRLVRESLNQGSVDVIQFLAERAKVLGLEISPARRRSVNPVAQQVGVFMGAHPRAQTRSHPLPPPEVYAALLPGQPKGLAPVLHP